MTVSEPCALSSLGVVPWKNGGGATRTLAVEPPDATLNDFLWRISMAEVGEPGEFSLFPGIDRTILLWSGNGLVLRAANWSFTVAQPLAPFSFRGEDKIVCELIGGPTTDLNVMVRRGAAEAVVSLAWEPVTLTQAADVLIVLCAAGSVTVSGGYPGFKLKANEFVRMEPCEPETILCPSSSDAKFLYMLISRVHPQHEGRMTLDSLRKPQF
jgi:uncharacterized protein